MLACLLTGCVFPTERWKTEEHLAMANDYLARGDFSAALTESRTALDLYPQLLGDRALFQIGLIYGHPGNPQRNVAKAREAFRDVTTRYPESQVLGNLQGLEAAVSAKDRELDRLAEQLRNEQRKARKRQAQEKKIVESKEDNLEKAIEDKDRQIKELEEDIDQLKEVDIKIDEKKRKVTP
jgi:DNA anti-recombination protein RmuC